MDCFPTVELADEVLSLRRSRAWDDALLVDKLE